jgi:hypothetical protein
VVIVGRRVLAAEGLRLRPLPRPGRWVRKPFPDWVTYTPNSIWIFDTTHFTRAGVAATVIEDLMSRKWLAEMVSAEETSTQVQVVFTEALEREGLLARITARQDGLVDPSVDDPSRPILLVLSDNAPADDLRLHPRVHGAVRDPPALWPARHADRSGLDLGRCLATSRPSGPTWPRSPTPRCCAPSLRWSASTTTAAGCTQGSATSPRTTSTRAVARRSARPAKPDSSRPAAAHRLPSRQSHP